MEKVEINRTKGEATKVGQAIVFATSWKENELGSKIATNEKGPGRHLTTN